MNIRARGPQKQRPSTPPAGRGSTGNRRNSRTSTARWRCSPVRSFVWPTALVKSFLVRIEKSSPLPTQTLSFRPPSDNENSPHGPASSNRSPARPSGKPPNNAKDSSQVQSPDSAPRLQESDTAQSSAPRAPPPAAPTGLPLFSRSISSSGILAICTLLPKRLA